VVSVSRITVRAALAERIGGRKLTILSSRQAPDQPDPNGDPQWLPPQGRTALTVGMLALAGALFLQRLEARSCRQTKANSEDGEL
jgi:hypothetical protein